MRIYLKMNKACLNILADEIENVSSKAPICPMLLGEPGIGKSSIVRNMCEMKGWHFYELLCNQLSDRADLTGCRTVKVNETINNKTEEVWSQIFFPHKAIQDAINAAKNNPDDIVVLFLDEINRTSSDITSAVLSFITARTIGTYTFPDNIRFIVAGNDKGNTISLDEASLSRFVKYELRPDATEWINYEKDHGGINPYIEMELNANPDLIFCKAVATATSTIQTDDGDDYETSYEAFDDGADGFNQITTPRTLSGLNAFLRNCNLEKLTAYNSTLLRDEDTGDNVSLLQAIIYGHTGYTQFSNNLIKRIAEDIINGSMKKASSRVTAPDKPKSYSAIKRCNDRTTRTQMIRNMTNDEMSEMLLYLLWEKGVDNTDLINEIANAYDSVYLSSIYGTKLTFLYGEDMLDADNVQAFINTGTPLANNYNAILFNGC